MRRRHLAAGALIAALAVVNLRGWLFQDIVPHQDFPGYAAAARDVRDSVLHHGLIPAWQSRWFGGTTDLFSHLKECVALPLVMLAGPVRGLELTILLAKIAAALAFYAFFVREFAAPLAGLVASYAYVAAPCANHVTERLDVALSYLLAPLLLMAATDLVRRWRPAPAAVLGFLLACQLDVSYMVVFVALVTLLLLAVFGPWRVGGSGRSGGDGRVGLAVAVAAGTFLVFAGSQLTWLATDLSNHLLFSPAQIAFAQVRFIEYSPFLLLNRGNWMGGWLAAHLPPGADTGDAWLDARYAGGAVVGVSVAGWFALRRDPALRRWYQLGTALALFEYAMSTGPRTVLWELVASLHGSEAVVRRLEGIAVPLAVVAAVRGIVLLSRARRDGDADGRRRAELWLGTAAVVTLVSRPLFTLVAATIPGIGGIRSPGKFFDLIPFAVSLVFGVSLVGLRAKLGDGGRRWCTFVALVAVLVVVDFWPSTRRFHDGTPPGAFADLHVALRELPGEGGTLRVLGVSPVTWLARGPVVSLLMMDSDAGGVRSWLPWQAGRHWPDFVSTDTSGRRRLQCLPWNPETSCEFLALARVKYVLETPPWVPLGPPWRVRAATDSFTLWERPDVMPMAYGTRAWVGFGGGADRVGAVVDEALAHRALVMSVDGSPDAPRWPDVPGADRPLVDVSYARPGPEKIVLETDAGGEPAAIHVAESYHPWWRARVDGQPATVARSQRSFMAVRVGPGRHRIELRFEPPLGVRVADAVAVAAWGLLGLGALVAVTIALSRSGSAARRPRPPDPA